ncbi:condensation protein [Streptomyces griseoviridis]
MERSLAPHEAAIASAGVRLVLHSELEGGLDDAVLARALVQLRKSYPLTAGSITHRTGETRPHVQVEEPAAGPALGHSSDFDDEISAPLDWEKGPLLRVSVVRDGRTRVVMTLPRAFADAMSYQALHQRLWTLYTALATGRPLPAGPVRPVLGPALDDILAARFTPARLRDFVAERARLDTQAPPALLPALASRDGGPGPDPSFGITRVEASPRRYERLLSQARTASLSLNSLVSGALLTSLRSLFPTQKEPVRVLCTMAVDMRRRLSPPMPPEILQSAATTTSIRLWIGGDAQPVDVGRDMAAQLRAHLDSGAAAMELAAFPYMLEQRPPSLVITNVGTIVEPPLPPGLRISRVRLAPLGRVPMIFAVISRYRGRLTVDLTHSRAWYTETQIKELSGHLAAALEPA